MRLLRGLSGRLLLVTVMVVMLTEVLVFLPSIARFRVTWLEEHLRRAEIAAMTVMAAPDRMVPGELGALLLDRAGVLNIVLVEEGRRSLVLAARDLPEISESYDLRNDDPVQLVGAALACLFGTDRNMVFRVIGEARGTPADLVEITVPVAPLRAAMRAYAGRVLDVSLVISLVSAVVVFFVVRRLVVTPVERLARNVQRFRDAPEDPGRILVPGQGPGEIAEAERAIADMQRQVQRSLAERARLAGLGEAVAKINHDLRNMLATGQLMTDRLGLSSDPTVARVLPKLVSSMDRAIALCQRTLDYGRAEEAAPVPRRVALLALAREVVEGLGLHDGGTVAARVEIGPDQHVMADPDQLYRVLANLVRNAAEAIQAAGRPGEIVLTADPEAGGVQVIRVRDTGPGMPAEAQANLFRPFRGGTRAGGTGLGLAIARDLVTAHGGSLELVSSTTEGTEFAIRLPASSPLLEAAD